MRAGPLSRLFLALGLLVGAAAGVGLLTGFEPARLPPALLNIAAYKLTFLAAFGLLATGGVLRRRARQSRPAGTPADLPAGASRHPTQLAAGMVPGPSPEPRRPEHARPRPLDDRNAR